MQTSVLDIKNLRCLLKIQVNITRKKYIIECMSLDIRGGDQSWRHKNINLSDSTLRIIFKATELGEVPQERTQMEKTRGQVQVLG